MDIQTDKPVNIFRNTYNDMVFFKLGISKKNANGEFESGSIPCQFKRGVDIPDKTKIYIRHAWLSFYKDKDKRTIPYIFINDFVTVEDRIKEAHIDIPDKEEDPFTEFGNEITLTDDDLPF